MISVPLDPIRKTLAPVLTVADLDLIEGLPDDVRAAVDRYMVSVGAPPIGTGTATDALYAAYRRGFEDGAQETAENVSPAYPPRELPKDWHR